MTRALCLLLLAPGLALAAPARTKVAVPPASGTDRDVGNTLAELVAAELGRDARISVTTSSDIAALLGIEAQRQLLECDAGASCLADIGGALGVDFVVSVQVGQLESSRLLSGSLVATKGGRSTARVVERLEGGAPLDAAAVRLAKHLRDALLAEHAALHPEDAVSAGPSPVLLGVSAGVAVVGAVVVGLAWKAALDHQQGSLTAQPTLTWPEAQAVRTQAGVGWGVVALGLAGVGASFVF